MYSQIFHFTKYRFFISPSTDFHFRKCRFLFSLQNADFSFRKVQIFHVTKTLTVQIFHFVGYIFFISQSADFSSHKVQIHFILFHTIPGVLESIISHFYSPVVGRSSHL